MVWPQAETLLQLVLAVIHSVLAKLSFGFERINYLLKWTVSRCIPSSLHGNPKLQFSTKGHILLEELTISYHNSLVQGSIVAQNIQVRGISSASLQSMSFDLSKYDNLSFGCCVTIPELTVDSNYRFCGKLAAFRPLRHTGHMTILLKRLTVEVKLTGHLKEVDGKKFLDLTAMKMTPNIPHLQFELSDPDCLEPRECSLRVTLNNMVWQRLYDVVFLHVEQEIARMVISFVQQFTSRVPFYDIFIFDR